MPITRFHSLLLAALLRVVFLFGLSRLSFLQDPLPDSLWIPNRWFSQHAEALQWMDLVLFLGGLIILAMALWAYTMYGAGITPALLGALDG